MPLKRITRSSLLFYLCRLRYTAFLSLVTFFFLLMYPFNTRGQDWEKSISIELQEDKEVEGFILTGSILLPFSIENIWKVITDYDGIKDFVPEVKESELESDSGDTKIIRQVGESSYLFFKKKIELRLRVTEDFHKMVHFTLVEGKFKRYTGRWILENAANGNTKLDYYLEVDPDFFAPKFITRRILKNKLKSTLLAIGERVSKSQKMP